MRPAGRGALSKPLGAMGRPYWGAVFVSLLCLIRPTSAGRCACLFRYRRHWRRITDGAQRRGALVARIEWQSVGLLKNVSGKYGGMVNHKYRPELSARRPRSAGKAPPAIPVGWQAGFTLQPWHWSSRCAARSAVLLDYRPARPALPLGSVSGQLRPVPAIVHPERVWHGHAVRRQASGSRTPKGAGVSSAARVARRALAGLKNGARARPKPSRGRPGALRVFR